MYEYACFIRKNIQVFNLNYDNNEYSTRSKDVHRIPLHKTAHFKYSPHYPRVNIYQNIPDNILNLHFI